MVQHYDQDIDIGSQGTEHFHNHKDLLCPSTFYSHATPILSFKIIFF